MLNNLKKNSAAFTMVELAITLTILSIITASILLETLMGSSVKAENITIQRMNAIQDALRVYYRMFYRIPCPAPGQVAVDTTAYGTETGTMGTCTDNATYPMFGPANNVAMGTVPTKALALPDEYGLDGWGRKIMYAVDRRYTAKSETHTVPMAILVYDPAVSTVTEKSKNAALLFSCGKNGNGAFPATGSTIANRISSLTANANETQNITFASFDEKFYQTAFNPDGSGTARFDQIIYPITFDVVH